MKKQTVFILLLFFISWNIKAQNLSKAGVLKMNIRSAGPIIQNDQVKGYYLFYLVEKEDRKNYNYLLTVYDENLREINSTTITRPRTFFLVEAAFNGESFGFLFYDSKLKKVEIIAYDKTLKQTGSVNQEVSNKFLLATYKSIALGQEPAQAFLVSVTKRGFIYYGLMDGNKAHYDVSFYDNNLKRVWNKKVEKNSEYAIETANEAYQSEEYIASLITKKKRLTSNNMDTDLLVQDASSGKVIFTTPMETEKYTVSFSEVYFDKNEKSFTVFGEYFNKEDKELKARGLGFITITYDMQGNIIKTKTNSWENDISKAAPVNERGKFDGNNTNILFHNIIRTDDGKIFVVGEQYKKAANAAGIAVNLLVGYGSASNVQLNIYNMVIFEFMPDYTIKKVHVFEKDKNVLYLPPGYGSFSPRLLSYYAKSVGGFDYAFTQKSKDNSTFYVSYVNYDKEKGEKAKNVLGTIVYTPEKTFTVDKLPLSRKSTAYFVYRAKEGYVMITEYFKKEKRLDTRLEKVNY